jgi:hypothetical protein
MRIEEKLPQFQGQRSLMIVTGSQEAVLYLAENGKVWEKQRIQVEDAGYSDKEGAFKSSSGAESTTKAGSIYKEKISFHLIKDFLGQLQEAVKDIIAKDKPKDIYLFCPEYMKKEIFKKMPKDLKKTIRMIKLGNYVSSHPFELLQGIKEKEEEGKEGVVTPIKAKALKILKKTSGFVKKRKQ